MKAQPTLTTFFWNLAKTIKDTYLLSIYSYWYEQSLSFFSVSGGLFPFQYCKERESTLNFLLLLKKIHARIRDAKTNQSHNILIKYK